MFLVLFLITGAVIPAWIIFVLHANDLFAVIFGEAWRTAGIYGVFLSIPAIPLLISNWLDRGYDALGKQRTAFWLEIVFSVFSVAGLCFGVFVLESILIGIVIQMIVLTVYYWVGLWVLLKESNDSRTVLNNDVRTICVRPFRIDIFALYEV